MQWHSVVRLIWLLVIIGISILGALAAAEYKGSVWIYIVFTALSFVVLFFGFGRKAIFFDAFIGVLVWIGFWLKFSVQTAFFEGRFNIPVGAFDGSPHSLDQALLVICCALAAILLARFIRQYFFSYPDSLPDIVYTGLYAFYRRYRVFVIVAFILAVLAVCISNAWYGIYQRGLVSRVNLPFGLNGVYAWLLMFGMASVSAVLLRFEFELNRDRYWIAITIGLLEATLSNISLWSRGMILNGSSLLYGAVAQYRRKEPRFRVGLTTFVIVIFLFFFAVSVVTVNYLRAQTFYGGYSQAERKEAVIEQTSVLFLDRWVGIEGLMSVVGAPDKNWNVFREALAERFDENSNAFYDARFIASPYDNSRDDGLHFVSLPGYIAFLYYSGSLIFMFCAVFAFSIVAAFFEYYVYRLGGKNLVLCALIAQVIAFRYTSFGYVPMQSYMLLGSIILNIVILFSLDRFLRFFYKI